jgi:hypothetical protein
VNTCLVVASSGSEGKNGICFLLVAVLDQQIDAPLQSSFSAACAAGQRLLGFSSCSSLLAFCAAQVAVLNQSVGSDGVFRGIADDPGTFDQAVHVIEISADGDGIEQRLIAPAGIVHRSRIRAGHPAGRLGEFTEPTDNGEGPRIRRWL